MISSPGKQLTRTISAVFVRPLDYVAARPALALVLPGALHLVLAWLLIGRFGYPVPLVPDEFSYLLGADTFASGRLANPTHPLWVYFETVFVLHVPSYVSMYHPAQALALAAGQRFLGHPWFGVAISAALMCSMTGWMLRSWVPPRWAVLGSLLAVQLAIIGLWHDQTGYWTGSYWGGAVAALGGALVLGALGRFRVSPRPIDACLFGVGILIMATSRPYEGLLLMLGVTIALALMVRRRAFTAGFWLRRLVVPAGIVLALGFGALAFYCFRTTGSATRLPYTAVLDQYMVRRMFYWGKHQPKTYRHAALGRHYRALLREGVTPAFKVVNFTGRLSRFYFGPVLLLSLLMIPWVFRDKRFGALLICLIPVLIGVALVEWIHIHYIAPVAAGLIALTVQCLRHIRTLHIRSFPIGRLAVLVLVLGNLVVAGNHARANWGSHSTGWWVDRHQMIESLTASGGKHLIIVRYADDHPPFQEWIFNAADIDGASVVWAREMADNKPLLNYFKDRTVWLFEPDKTPLQLQPYR
jgi:hypothetical protein